MRFRKRPVEIEAVQFPRIEVFADDVSMLPVPLSLPEYAEIAAWVGPELVPEWIGDNNRWTLFGRIRTLEGTLYVQPEAWVVRGVRGEHYAVHPDIFAQTYERIEE